MFALIAIRTSTLNSKKAKELMSTANTISILQSLSTGRIMNRLSQPTNIETKTVLQIDIRTLYVNNFLI